MSRKAGALAGLQEPWGSCSANAYNCEHTLTPGFEVFNRMFNRWKGTSWEMSPGAANFFAGGLASNLYWFSALRESRPPRRLPS